MSELPLRQYEHHPRDWRRNVYVYPVISRRSGGLSIGVNLNPDTACNFDCIYCQVDRSKMPRVREVDVERLGAELEAMIELAKSGALFDDPGFGDVPEAMRSIKDIAFSGDGEPTTCKRFRECVELVARVRHEARLDETKIVLITDACYLTRPEVEVALTIMDEENGEIWAKLDAGTEAYYQKINRPNYPLTHVIDNIIAAARVRPVVIQSLFMRVEGEPPGGTEVAAFVERLKEITNAGGKIDHVQVYTVARRPAEDYVTALTKGEVDHIVALVRRDGGLQANAYYGPG
ncbi:MAG: radical SAM protein [Phycisphaerae bacterium]|jgi:wyosine [tRNA(Phe)-imidazoG37] synthetase (radical SAM superfamily)